MCTYIMPAHLHTHEDIKLICVMLLHEYAYAYTYICLLCILSHVCVLVHNLTACACGLCNCLLFVIRPSLNWLTLSSYDICTVAIIMLAEWTSFSAHQWWHLEWEINVYTCALIFFTSPNQHRTLTQHADMHYGAHKSCWGDARFWWD